MLHRNKKENDYHKGKWNGLGGKAEAGESPEECAMRELYEESGLKAEKMQMKGFITFPMFDGINDWHVFLFTVSEFEGELIECNEGHLEWVPDDKLTELNLWEGDKIFIPWLFEDRFFSAKFIYENKQYISHTVNFY
ncbi:MAG: 8-oxo-dGTP diphosphatase [Ignavibacteriaceae bacterium]|jgi:8-oxo-dGTP diphosphatase|nr:8-oxo-dGTP diphosphatase [Ignavibacteriaceae bacterium]